MKLAVGRYNRNSIDLYSLQEETTLPASEVDAVIISGTDCHIHVIPTRLTSTQQIRTFSDHYIKTVHPGPYDQLATDFLLIGKGDNRQIILVIIERELLSAYKSLNKPLYFFFQIDFMNQKNRSITYRANGISEKYRYADNVLKSIEISKNDNEEAFPARDISYRLNRKKAGKLFQNESRARTDLAPVLILLLTAILLIYNAVISYDGYTERDEEFKKKQEQIRAMAADRQAEPETSEEERDLLRMGASIRNSVPEDYYSMLSSIANSVRNPVSIKSLKISDRSVTINGSTKSALQLVEDLNKTGLFTELTPSRIYPLDDGKEDFSLTGVLQ